MWSSVTDVDSVITLCLLLPSLISHPALTVAFRIYDMDKDGYISNGELFQVLKMMVGNNLKDTQLQQIVDKTIINADKDGDGRISFEEFCAVSILGGAVTFLLMQPVLVKANVKGAKKKL